MKKDIRVAVLEKDPFARNWMVLLLSRDWRTRVVGEAGRPAELISFLKSPGSRVDVILLDVDLPKRDQWLPRLLELAASFHPPAAIICMGLSEDRRLLEYLHHPSVTGYLLKEEICHSLAWASALAVGTNWVITPGIQPLASSQGFSIPRPCFVLDGRYATRSLTEHQARVARLAFLFSMERRDLADELGISEDWGYVLVSSVYDRLGLKVILSDDVEPSEYLGNHALVLSYFKKIKEEFSGSGKLRDMETLAFHFMTRPEMRELPG